MLIIVVLGNFRESKKQDLTLILCSYVEKSEDSNATLPEPKETKGHGRLPHTAYANANANEYSIPIETLSPGQPCRMDCGG
ncbi:TPA: hypothetical protein ACMDL9_001872 [Legionella pneumophila]